jgi:hypothetical protein
MLTVPFAEGQLLSMVPTIDMAQKVREKGRRDAEVEKERMTEHMSE